MTKELLKWYRENQRNLPWRQTSDPYKIWLSEVMLQQTQVATVIQYYLRFTERFPTVHDLAEADEHDVFKLWEGLGYYSRARNLHKCAKTVVREWSGKFPEEASDLIKLPGVGPYTAGAVSSIAFNKSVPAVDGNVMRVISRAFLIDVDIANPKSRRVFEEKIMEIIPYEAGDFNQALMELGATHCSPQNPDCASCPISSHCMANAGNRQLEFPVKSPKPAKIEFHAAVLILISDDLIMLEKRNLQGLLKGLWGLPTFLKSKDDENFSESMILSLLEAEYGLMGKVLNHKAVKKHVFTHRVWHMTFYFINVEEVISIDDPEVKWISLEALADFPIPTAYRKNLTEDVIAQIEGWRTYDL